MINNDPKTPPSQITKRSHEFFPPELPKKPKKKDSLEPGKSDSDNTSKRLFELGSFPELRDE